MCVCLYLQKRKNCFIHGNPSFSSFSLSVVESIDFVYVFVSLILQNSLDSTMLPWAVPLDRHIPYGTIHKDNSRYMLKHIFMYITVTYCSITGYHITIRHLLTKAIGPVIIICIIISSHSLLIYW